MEASERDRPFLIKILCLLLLLSGIVGLYTVFFGADSLIKSLDLRDRHLVNLLLQFFDQRLVVLGISTFHLWLFHLLYDLRKLGWYLLFIFNVLTLIGLVINLISLIVNKAPLNNPQKIIIAVSAFLPLLGYYYLRSRRPHFHN
jgi:hypothetical protein